MTVLRIKFLTLKQLETQSNSLKARHFMKVITLPCIYELRGVTMKLKTQFITT